VRKLYPGAAVPVFEFDDSSPETLEMTYRSPRRLCALAVGFIEGAAAEYGEDVTVEHSVCVARGDGRCVFRVTCRPRSRGRS
jgi:predicted hydrocarbon binding protein